jgi:hypothetical protein
MSIAFGSGRLLGSRLAKKRSVSSTTPELVSNRVVRTLEFRRYERELSYLAVGSIEKVPPRCGSRMPAKIAGLSNRGQQSQSIEPVPETSAALRQSPTIA